MTEPTPAGASVDQLLTSVEQLTAAADRTQAGLHKLAQSSRRHRVLLVLAIVGLTLDLALSGLFIYQRYEQSCTNTQLRARQTINQRSFRAEYDKVAGQVAGLKKLRGAGTDQVQAYAGFDQFIAASETYLDRITSINADLRAHPVGTC